MTRERARDAVWLILACCGALLGVWIGGGNFELSEVPTGGWLAIAAWATGVTYMIIGPTAEETAR